MTTKDREKMIKATSQRISDLSELFGYYAMDSESLPLDYALRVFGHKPDNTIDSEYKARLGENLKARFTSCVNTITLINTYLQIVGISASRLDSTDADAQALGDKIVAGARILSDHREVMKEYGKDLIELMDPNGPMSASAANGILRVAMRFEREDLVHNPNAADIVSETVTSEENFVRTYDLLANQQLDAASLMLAFSQATGADLTMDIGALLLQATNMHSLSLSSHEVVKSIDPPSPKKPTIH